MQINMKDSYTTRSGLPARVLCVDLKDEIFTVVAVITLSDSIESVATFKSNGSWAASKGKYNYDLIPVPKFKTPTEQVEELLAIAKADTGREWFTGAPPAVGWYPCNMDKGIERLAYFDGESWSWSIFYYGDAHQIRYVVNQSRRQKEKVFWTMPWWPAEWNQAYWEKVQ